MSDAIRCGQCRWWRATNEIHGVCELNPPVWIDADHTTGEDAGWYQPFTDGMKIGCSRGEPKQGYITVKLTEEKLQPRRFEEET